MTKNFKFDHYIDLYNDQLWFIGHMVLPLWKILTNMNYAPS